MYSLSAIREEIEKITRHLDNWDKESMPSIESIRTRVELTKLKMLYIKGIKKIRIKK